MDNVFDLAEYRQRTQQWEQTVGRYGYKGEERPWSELWLAARNFVTFVIGITGVAMTAYGAYHNLLAQIH